VQIINFQAENIKRIVAVQIKPRGNLVQITGKNGNGKTSVLDSIWWALDGKDAIQSTPIRKGNQEGSIILVLGDGQPELIVTRTFKIRAGGELTTSITVESPDGAMYKSPQKMLDAFFGALTFDPLEFARMKPREQYDQLKRFVPGVDFKAIADANRGDYTRRQDINRAAEEQRGAAAVIVVPEGTTTDLVDVKALVEQLGEAGGFNTSIETRKVRRQAIAEGVVASRNRAAQIRESSAVGIDQIAKRYASHAAELRARIQELEAEIANERLKLDSLDAGEKHELEQHQAQVERNAQEFETAAAEAQKQLDEAEVLPAPIDTEALAKRIDAATAANAQAERLRQRNVHEQNAARLELESKALTKKITDREAEKNTAIAAAQIPVTGIGFGDEEVLLNGVPFNQGSDAEQLAASCDIAMAMSPKLRVIRIRDGSLLDPDSMKILEAKAKDRKFQVWIERVDASGKIGFVIEDGHARDAEETTTAEETT
jgi:hypothetical protein